MQKEGIKPNLTKSLTGAWGKGGGVAEAVLAPGKRWGLSRISGSLGTQSMSRLEAVQSSSGAPMALWSVQDVS